MPSLSLSKGIKRHNASHMNFKLKLNNRNNNEGSSFTVTVVYDGVEEESLRPEDRLGPF